jgi:hypothetical protein
MPCTGLRNVECVGTLNSRHRLATNTDVVQGCTIRVCLVNLYLRRESRDTRCWLSKSTMPHDEKDSSLM